MSFTFSNMDLIKCRTFSFEGHGKLQVVKLYFLNVKWHIRQILVAMKGYLNLRNHSSSNFDENGFRGRINSTNRAIKWFPLLKIF